MLYVHTYGMSRSWNYYLSYFICIVALCRSRRHGTPDTCVLLGSALTILLALPYFQRYVLRYKRSIYS